MTLRRATFALRVLLALACVSSACQATERMVPSRGEEFTFRRGIGVGHPMAWATIEGGSRGGFAFPPFLDDDRAFPPTEIRALRTAGLDFVRLAIDPGPFLAFEGRQREYADRFLKETVARILAEGLAVIVDLHPSDLHPAYFSTELTEGLHTPKFQAYLELLARTAASLAALDSPRIALELMNEPQVSAAAWQPMLEAAYATARKAAPHLTLILGGGLQNSVEGLRTIDTRPFAGDAAVVYTFHYYDPYQFTHQGAAGNDAALLANVPYPADVRPLRESLASSGEAVAAAKLDAAGAQRALASVKRQLENYRRSGFDRAAIARDLDQVAEWARGRGIRPSRILLGEFGARLTPFTARTAERERWLREVREETETRGFGWAAWVYRGAGGFALARNETGPGLDPIVMRALNLAGAGR